MSHIPFLLALASSLVAAAVVVAVRFLWPGDLPIVAPSGERGHRRLEARARHTWFRAMEPPIRSVARVIAALPIRSTRALLSHRLRMAGRPLGLDPDELLATILFSAALASAAGAWLSEAAVGSPGPGSVLGALMGAALPWFKVDDAARRRIREVCRGLPQAIDLVALAMNAGLDFTGAVRQVAQRTPPSSPMGFELAHLLHKLSIGNSRREALEGLAARVPAQPVRQFVAAVTQAEKQGTPLARVLGVQAKVMRTRRSQAAEQAAARAAILILGPLMLIFTCVFIVLLGPFAIKAIRGEMF